MTRCKGVGTLALVAVLCVVPVRGAVAGTPPAFPRPPAADADDVDVAIRDLLPFGLRGRDLPSPKWRDAGFAFLCRTQQGDGRWEAARSGRAFDLGVTALAALAFLAGGVRPTDADDAGRALRRALDALTRAQDAEGCLGERTAAQFVYVHAFGALALVEAFAVTGDRGLQKAAQRAVDFVGVARNPWFGWRYGVKPGDNDTSVTGCMGAVLHAVREVNRACQEAGIAAPLRYDEDAIDGIRAWVEKMTDPDYGRVGYFQRGSGSQRLVGLLEKFPPEKAEAMTGVGLFLRWVVGDSEVRKSDQARGAELLRNVAPRWDNNDGSIDLYAWFWGTHGLRCVGGKPWEVWRASLNKALLAAQDPESGGWPEEDAWSSVGGATYTTSLALLSLFANGRYEWRPDDRRALVAAASAAASPPVRAQALRALAMRPVAGTTAVALRALGASDVDLRRAAAAALVPSAREAEVPRLVAVLAEADEDVAASAALALGRLRAAAAVPGLVRALESPSVRLRSAALWAMGELGPAAVSSASDIERALRDESQAVRVEAVRALRLVRGRGASGLDHLVAALGADDPFLQRRALEAIGAHGVAAGAAAGRVADLLSTSGASESARSRSSGLPAESRWMRIRDGDATGAAAATALEALGPEARGVRLALETGSLLAATQVERSAAASALRRLDGPPSPTAAARPLGATPTLPGDGAAFVASLRDPEEVAALSPLLRDPAVIPRLLGALTEADESARIRAIEALGAFGPAAVNTAEALAKAAAGARPRIVEAVLRALRRVGGEWAVKRDVVLEGLRAEDEQVRLAALDLVAELPAKTVEPSDRLRVDVLRDGPVLLLRTLPQGARWGADEAWILAVTDAPGLADARLDGRIVDTLAALRPLRPATVSALLAVGDKRDVPAESVRAARTALGQVSRDDATIREVIVARWKGASDASWFTQAMMLGLGRHAASAAAERLRSTDERDTLAAASLLYGLGADAASVSTAVIGALRGSWGKAHDRIAGQLRNWFVDSLGPPGRATLIAGLQHATPAVREGAAVLMGADSYPKLAEFEIALTRALATEKDPDVRKAIRAAITANKR